MFAPLCFVFALNSVFIRVVPHSQSHKRKRGQKREKFSLARKTLIMKARATVLTAAP